MLGPRWEIRGPASGSQTGIGAETRVGKRGSEQVGHVSLGTQGFARSPGILEKHLG